MKLFLYGGGKPTKKDKFNQALLELLPKKDLKIVFIPSSGDKTGRYFKEFKERFVLFGFKKFYFFSLEEEYDKNLIKDIMACDAIYLSGGNTYHFLWWLKKRKFLNTLLDFVKKGGILMGSSAGSILMTPKIDISGAPYYDCDKNKIGLKDFKALNLVKFEFFPHYLSSPRLDAELIGYSKTTPYPVFAVKEQSGIIVWDKEIKIIGDYNIFYKGNSFKLI